MLTSITPTSLQPVHSFNLDHAVHTHAISPIPSTSPLVAAGTSHPTIRLLDLRSGLATHSLAGHNGAVYALAWSPIDEHILASGATDGRVFFFDIRRANAVFASLDLDDAIGVSLKDRNRLGGRTGELLNFSAQAHSGPVTSVQWTSHPHDKIVTAGHDQRIRVWDAASGRNELVHFGPRLKNARMGNFGPLLASAGYCSKPVNEVLLWANDDSKGDISVFGLREGDVRGTKQTGGVLKGRVAKESEGDRLRGRGRINAMVWREGDDSQAKNGLEMLSAHGDGTVGVWRVPELDGSVDVGVGVLKAANGEEDVNADEEDDERPKKKRKKQDFNALVEGLTKMK
ncbi:DNA excision repair protein ckn1 [Cyphellophora attinorum]|uniref:DNA excision repair protein ckn1 n=1 Tax=Cyphellophora attinorum TaxID=1664694 RepID=A0A0N1HBK5_9EURO|nr:DNA excision repair protein ckn1 [Phialophora attinorum]KPI46084.1 DNA excision repair protein ckn1 [Phialophora attinorum]